MTLKNRTIIIIAVTPNLIYAVALIGMMISRTAAGLQPLPHGAAPIVMLLTAFVPAASTALANILRLRRDADGS